MNIGSAGFLTDQQIIVDVVQVSASGENSADTTVMLPNHYAPTGARKLKTESPLCEMAGPMLRRRHHPASDKAELRPA